MTKNMGKVFFITIIVVAVILGIIAIAQQQKNQFQPYNTTPSITPRVSGNPNDLEQAGQNPSPSPTTPVTNLLFPQSEWVMSATSAAIQTAKGEIDIQLYTQDAPKTVTNFATLAKKGYYDGLTFHRVEPGFVIQGGDPNGNGTGGRSIYGDVFEDELNPQTPSYQAGYQEGVVAMANKGPNTNGSQFFIMLANNPSLPKNYSIFGKVTSGMDVVKKIQVGDKMTKVIID